MKVTFGCASLVSGLNGGWVAAGLALTLTACGSGGGTPNFATLSGGSGTAGTGFSGTATGSSSSSSAPIQIGFSGEAPFNPVAAKALFVYMPDFTSVSIADKSAVSGTPIVVRAPMGTGNNLSTASVDINATFSNASVGGSGVMNWMNGLYLNSTATFGKYHAVSLEPGTTLSDAQYGLINFEYGNAYGTGGFHGGNLTPVNQLPVTATYVGGFGGRMYEIGKSSYDKWTGVGGSVVLNANFTNNTISGSTMGISQAAATPFEINMNGTISGNSYTGTASIVSIDGKAVPAPTSSAINGAFYGANAAETAGALRLEGQVPWKGGTQANSVIVGAFGAKKQ